MIIFSRLSHFLHHEFNLFWLKPFVFFFYAERTLAVPKCDFFVVALIHHVSLFSCCWCAGLWRSVRPRLRTTRWLLLQPRRPANAPVNQPAGTRLPFAVGSAPRLRIWILRVARSLARSARSTPTRAPASRRKQSPHSTLGRGALSRRRPHRPPPPSSSYTSSNLAKPRLVLPPLHPPFPMASPRRASRSAAQ